MKRKDLLIVLVILILFINLVKSWVKLNERLRFLKESRLSLVEEQKKKENLERELARSQTSEFIERQAREKLNMGRDGEITILLPTPAISESPTPTSIDTSANWEKWVRLFW